MKKTKGKTFERVVYAMFYFTFFMQGAALLTLWTLLNSSDNGFQFSVKVAVCLLGILGPFVWLHK